MCYGMGCMYEDGNGECTKDRRMPCPGDYGFEEEEYDRAVQAVEDARDREIFSRYEAETGKDVS